MLTVRNWITGSALVLVVLPWIGACADHSQSTDGSTSSAATTATSVPDAPTTTSSSSFTDTSGADATAGPADCGLAGTNDELFLAGTFKLTTVSDAVMAPPSDVFAPLLNVDVCFGLTFAAEPVMENNQTRANMMEVALQTDDSSGVVAATFAPATTGLLNLRPVEFSPTVFVASIGTAIPMADAQYSFELACVSPTGFEIGGTGAPLFQSMVCDEGTVAVRRFVVAPNGQTLTDLVFGSASFQLHVP